jgi:hypothetical protein
MSLLYEAHRMNTIEPFSIGKLNISKPKLPDFVDKAKDKVVDVGGNVIDKTKDIGGNVIDKTKDIGGKVVDVGKNIGGKIVDIGKGIGKILGPAFKKLLEFLMMILKNWKIALGVVVGLFILFWVSRVVGFFRMFSG